MILQISNNFFDLFKQATKPFKRHRWANEGATKALEGARRCFLRRIEGARRRSKALHGVTKFNSGTASKANLRKSLIFT